jgi:hypothetical protein
MAIEDVEAKLLALAQDYDPLKHDTLVKSDPFWGAYSQSHRMRAFCEINVNDVDVTNRLEPHLISVRIVDGNQFECEIELDDRDALLPIPPIGGKVLVALGWMREQMYKMFDGVILSVEHGFGRKQGGRRMWIHANGWDMLKTKIKEPMDMNLGEGAPPGQKEGKKHSLTDWIQKLAKAGGGKAEISSAFAANMQDYWGAMGGSPLHNITELGQKFGAGVQWGSGNTVKFLKPGELGESCKAVWRDNLIGYRVHPFTPRSTYAASQASSYDNKQGQWIVKKLTDIAKGRGPAGDAAASGGGPAPQGTESGADQANTGAAQGQDASNLGQGRIVINGEPRARFWSLVKLEGVRPGVDGHYLIQVAEHIYSRQGYVTWLDVTPYGPAKGADSVLGNWPLPRPNPNQG